MYMSYMLYICCICFIQTCKGLYPQKKCCQGTVWPRSPAWEAVFLCPGVGGTKPISSVPSFCWFFKMIKTLVTYWITHSDLTGVTTYEWDWKDITGTLVRSNISLAEKLVKGTWVTPTAEVNGQRMPSFHSEVWLARDLGSPVDALQRSYDP